MFPLHIKRNIDSQKKLPRSRKTKNQGLQSLRAPESDAADPMRGRVPVAARRAHAERVIVTPAAAQDGLISGRRPLWIPCRAIPMIVCIIPIGYPFPDVPGHVVCAIRALPALIA